MAINENIIAAYLDGTVTYQQADNAVGGLSAADNALIIEASHDDDTIALIAEGADPQQWSDELATLDNFQLPDLPIIAQEADDNTDEFEIVEYTDNTDLTPSPATEADDTFDSDPQTGITDFPDNTDLPDFDTTDMD